MNLSMIFLLTFVILAGAVFVAFASNIQGTTKWLGDQIAEKKVIRTTPYAFASALEVQTMISSSGVVVRNFSGVALYVVVLVIGFLIKWWVALLGLVILFLISGIVSVVFLPRRLSYWIKWVSVGVQNRIADYRKNNDLDRAESLSVFLPILAEYEQLADSQSLDVHKL